MSKRTEGPKAGEKAVNQTLATAIVEQRPKWAERVTAESTNVLQEKRKVPDIVVTPPEGQAVVIETEHAPAGEVVADAEERLGAEVIGTGERIETVFAVRLPATLKGTRPGTANTHVRTETYEFKICTGKRTNPVTWPTGKDEWAVARFETLVDLIEVAGLSERKVADSLDTMERAVERTATFLMKDERRYPDQGRDIGRALHQKEGEQTYRMGMAMVVNALVFHEIIAGNHDVKRVEDLPKRQNVVKQQALVDEWNRILTEVNYWPIFAIARQIVSALRTQTGHAVLKVLVGAAGNLVLLGAGTTHALASRMFQRLIADRKFLASYYTRSESATLLAELLTQRMEKDWTRTTTYEGFRIGDLACGTGTLLYASYEAIGRRMRSAGLDDASLHRTMMEQCLVGADIMPSATHLATSQLASVHPTQTFGKTRVHTMPYGEGDVKKGEASIAIGSLEWLESERQIALFATGGSQLSGTHGEIGSRTAELKDEELDICIMNPPFSRSTNHEAEKWNVPAPAFAGFGTDKEEQKRMSEKLARAYRSGEERMGHGNAGLGSNFLDVAKAKTKPGGQIGFILPAALLSGEGWKNARDGLRHDFEDVLLVALANAEPTGRAWSADTDMAETMVIARKRTGNGQTADAKVRYVNVHERPKTEAEALLLAHAIHRQIGQGTQGDLTTTTNGHAEGSWIEGNFTDGGLGQVRDTKLCLVARGIERGRVDLPRHTEGRRVPTIRLGELGSRGPVDRDLTGGRENGRERGPFKRRALKPGPEYPMLWTHEAGRERRLTVEPDEEGVPKSAEGCRERATEMWNRHASRFHTNRDFRLNSQSLAACLTPEACLGGRAWPTFRLSQEEWMIPVLLWMNSTLGLLEFWWKGTRQQSGRTTITISRIPELKVLDPRKLGHRQIEKCEALYEEISQRDFLPAHRTAEDPVRKALDEGLYGKILNWRKTELDGLGVVRAKWCAEPTVHGGKKDRDTMVG